VQFIFESRAFLLELADYGLHQGFWRHGILSPGIFYYGAVPPPNGLASYRSRKLTSLSADPTGVISFAGIGDSALQKCTPCLAQDNGASTLTLRGRGASGPALGSHVAVTRERVRQIEAKALRRLRHPSRSRRLRAFVDGVRD